MLGQPVSRFLHAIFEERCDDVVAGIITAPHSGSVRRPMIPKSRRPRAAVGQAEHVPGVPVTVENGHVADATFIGSVTAWKVTGSWSKPRIGPESSRCAPSPMT